MGQTKRSSTTATSPPDELVATRIEVTRIRQYDRNPRRQQNPKKLADSRGFPVKDVVAEYIVHLE